MIPKAAQAKDLLKAQFLEPLGKRENFVNSIRTQNRRQTLTRKRALTVARYMEEPHVNNSKEKEETEPREEEKVESLPDLPPPKEEEKKSSTPNTATILIKSVTKQVTTHPKGSDKEATRKVTNVQQVP